MNYSYILAIYGPKINQFLTATEKYFSNTSLYTQSCCHQTVMMLCYTEKPLFHKSWDSPKLFHKQITKQVEGF